MIANAVKYTRDRDPATIEIDCAEDTAGRVVIRVRDNSAGFDTQYAGKLFGVFQRLHHADEFEGTAVGLSNVRRIVERHGGEVWADGKVGAGASFLLSFPRIPAVTESQPEIPTLGARGFPAPA